MFQTKQEVDKHVSNSLKRIDNNTDRNLRCYAWAKLYYDVGEYEHAVRYVHSYLSVKPKSVEAHNLLGQSLEKLGKSAAALEAYKTSLHQDSNQPRIVMKVCELISQDDVEMEMPIARYFCDLAQSIDPNNSTISTLKERIIINEGKDPQEVLQFLREEIESKPNDVGLMIKQLRHLMKNKMIREAYNHASKVEEKDLNVFRSNSLWYETFAKVLMEYQKDVNLNSQLTWEFWLQSASVLERLASLSLDDYLGVVQYRSEYIDPIFNFDQFLYNASQNIDNCPDKILLQEFLDHYEAQLSFHLCVLAFKQAKTGFTPFKKVRSIILPLLFIAYNTHPPDVQSLWFHSISESIKRVIINWHKAASFRCSQAGHILRTLLKDNVDTLLIQAKNSLVVGWREIVFKQIFVKRDQHLKHSSSFFVKSCVEPILKLPAMSSLMQYDEVSQAVYPDSLHHYIWIALNCSKLSHFELKTFETLQYTVSNFNNCAAESLSYLDVLAFIYCATLCAQDHLKNKDHNLSYFSEDRPEIFPVSITACLPTLNQAKFLNAAYKMYTKAPSSGMSEIRQILLKGIEVVRCVGNHGLDVKILIELANTFAERAEASEKQLTVDANNARAEHYWNIALPFLEGIKNNYAIVYPRHRLFELSSNEELSEEDACLYIEKAHLFLGQQLLRKKEYEKAMITFEKLKDPYASYYQSLIYKSMAELEDHENITNVTTTEMKSQNSLLLSRALDCLYVTLDRLKHPNQDRNHPLNLHLGTEIERLEHLISGGEETDCLNKKECDGTPDEDSRNKQVLDYYLNTSDMDKSLQQRQAILYQSTPARRQEARPSAERLDAQLRQLVLSKDVTMNNVIEQNKLMTELQKSLIDEIKGFKEAVSTLTSTVQDQAKSFKGYYKDVEDMKASVNHLVEKIDYKLQDVTEVVQEIKKDVNEIKREQKKVTQLNEDDLYALDSEYNSALEYNLDSALGNATQSVNLQPPLSNPYGPYPSVRLGPHAPPAPPAVPFPTQGHQVYPGYPAQPPWLWGIPPWNYINPHLGVPSNHLLTSEPQQLNHHLNQLPSTGPTSTCLTGFNPLPSTGPISTGFNLPATLPQKTLPPLGYGLSPGVMTSQVTHSIPSSVMDTIKTTLSVTGVISSSPHSQSNFGVSSICSSVGANTEMIGGSITASKVMLPTTAVATVSTSLPTISSLAINKLAPVNVVITSSDPLPNIKMPSTQSQVLSVTIPPQHIKGNVQKITSTPSSKQQPHIFQIPVPSTPTMATFSNKSTPSTQLPFANIQTTSSLSFDRPWGSITANVSVEPNKNTSATGSLNISNVSSTSLEEYDPRPDFQPIIPLPAEVTVTTGEENETELYCQHAKLFRYVNNGDVKEWKERGVGNLKFLFNPETKKIRLIMRRDHVHKVCANHYLTKDMSLTQMKNTNAYLWAALDFADGEQVLEKFCARFKTEDESKKFAEQFEKAKQMIEDPSTKITITTTNTATTTISTVTTISTINDTIPSKSTTTLSNPANLGGFKFTSAPTFKLAKESKIQPKADETKNDTVQTSPFASFTFGAKTNTQPSKFANLWPSKISDETSQQSENNEKSFAGTYWKPPAKDSWKCKTCEVVNTVDKNTCAACSTPKDDQPKQEQKEKQPLKGIDLSVSQNFSFGIPKVAAVAPQSIEPKTSVVPSGAPVKTETTSAAPSVGFGDMFKAKANSWNCNSCYVNNESTAINCISCGTAKNAEEVKKVPPVSNSGTFIWGSTTPTTLPATKFSSPASKLENTIKDNIEPSPSKSIDKNKFGVSPQRFDFEFKPKSPRRISNGQADESDGSYVEEEEPNVYFKPVIPLPDKVEVKTGEENHAVLYCHRAKLFRYVNGEWKERGIGDVKILKDNETGRLRVLMRRDQIWKICLNHLLNSDIQYMVKDDKTWLFSAIDFTEGEPKREQFCIRFKNHQIAEDFKKAVDEAITTLKTDSQSPEEIDSDVEFVSETEVPLEEQLEATRLGLPPKFMSYKQLPDCECKQCKADDEYLKELFMNKPPQAKTQNLTSVPIFGTPTSFSSSAGSAYGTPSASFVSSIQSPVTPVPLQRSQSIKEMLQTRNVSIIPISSGEKSKPPPVNWCSADKEYGTKSVVITPVSGKETSQFRLTVSVDKKGEGGVLKSGSSTNLFGFSSKDNTISQSAKIFEIKETENKKADSLVGICGNTGTTTVTPFKPPEIKLASSTTSTPEILNLSKSDNPASQHSFSSAKSNQENNSKKGNIFATNSISSLSSVSSSASNIFDMKKDNIFAMPSSNSTQISFFNNTNTNIFGGPFNSATTTSTTAFSKMSTGNLFSKPTSTIASNIFQNSPNLNSSTSSNTSIFNVFKTETSNTSITPITTATVAVSSTTNIFGSNSIKSAPTNTFNIFNTTPTTISIQGNSLFGGDKKESKVSEANIASVPTFGSSNVVKKPISEANFAEILKCDSSLSFGNLAAQASDQKPFSAGTGWDKTSFAFLGAGTPVFGLGTETLNETKTKATDEEKDSETSKEESHDDHDPHFEPIIALPDEIVVSTGEEDDTIVFKAKATLFRFDNDLKQWKERGVGDIKILFNPESKIYRLLMRRDQIHKIVLNQRITTKFELKAGTSERAWIWAGHNYIDDQFQLESLAIRFKNADLAMGFKNCIDKAIEMLSSVEMEAPTTLPQSVQNLSLNQTPSNLNPSKSNAELEADEGNTDEEEEEDDDEDDIDEEELYDDEDDYDYDVLKMGTPIIFHRPCTLSEQITAENSAVTTWEIIGSGNIELSFDLAIRGYRIQFKTADGEVLSWILIGMNTVMECKGKECIWTGYEQRAPEKVNCLRTLKATFKQTRPAMEMYGNYVAAVASAREKGIVDADPNNDSDELDV